MPQNSLKMLKFVKKSQYSYVIHWLEFSKHLKDVRTM